MADIRDALMKREKMGEKKAKSKAARIFISRGQNKSQRSMLAKMLHNDSER